VTAVLLQLELQLRSLLLCTPLTCIQQSVLKLWKNSLNILKKKEDSNLKITLLYAFCYKDTYYTGAYINFPNIAVLDFKSKEMATFFCMQQHVFQ